MLCVCRRPLTPCGVSVEDLPPALCRGCACCAVLSVAMDLLPSVAGSDSERELPDELEGNVEAAPGEEGHRAGVDVGVRLMLPEFQGACIGDDMSWKGSRVIRCVSLQGGGVGADAGVFGKWWGSSLGRLGADIGCVSEVGCQGAVLFGSFFGCCAFVCGLVVSLCKGGIAVSVLARYVVVSWLHHILAVKKNNFC